MKKPNSCTNLKVSSIFLFIDKKHNDVNWIIKKRKKKLIKAIKGEIFILNFQTLLIKMLFKNPHMFDLNDWIENAEETTFNVSLKIYLKCWTYFRNYFI